MDRRWTGGAADAGPPPRRAGLRAALPLLSLLVLLGGCSSTAVDVEERLDPRTAVTVKTVAAPFVYAHDVPAIAANARDYLSIGAVETNRMGTRAHYLVAVLWSTVDRWTGGTPPAAPERLRLVLDGKPHEWAVQTHAGREAGVGDPVFRPERGYLAESWFAVSFADLRALGRGAPATIESDDAEGTTTTWTAWRPGDREFAAFLDSLPEPVEVQRRR